MWIVSFFQIHGPPTENERTYRVPFVYHFRLAEPSPFEVRRLGDGWTGARRKNNSSVLEITRAFWLIITIRGLPVLCWWSPIVFLKALVLVNIIIQKKLWKENFVNKNIWCPTVKNNHGRYWWCSDGNTIYFSWHHLIVLSYGYHFHQICHHHHHFHCY